MQQKNNLPIALQIFDLSIVNHLSHQIVMHWSAHLLYRRQKRGKSEKISKNSSVPASASVFSLLRNEPEGRDTRERISKRKNRCQCGKKRDKLLWINNFLFSAELSAFWEADRPISASTHVLTAKNNAKTSTHLPRRLIWGS